MLAKVYHNSIFKFGGFNMTTSQFNVRLEKLHQQMIDVSINWNSEQLGRSIAYKKLIQEALENYFMKLLHSDRETILAMCQANNYDELLKLIKLNEGEV